MYSVNIFGPYPMAYQPTPIQITLFDVRIPCGFPSPATDCEEDVLDLNTYVIQNRAASFYFTVSGDSMTGIGICDGDRVAVDRSVPPRHGHIVVAVVNQEYTLKRLYHKEGLVELRPENPAYGPIRFQDGHELVIWGVVVAVIRKLAV
jgi:DNA polymerase V